MITRLIITIAIACALAPIACVCAAEHPEHPRSSTQIPPRKSEHPQQAAVQEISKADISAGIRKHIDSTTKKSADKKFHVNYGGQDLALDLIKVHDDRLSDLGSGKYFACVDMKATDGKTYDIDFFLAGKAGDMKVTETSVHKINGKPLYNWKEQGGLWKKVKA